MKLIPILFITLIFFNHSNAQSVYEKIALNSCDCLSSVENIEQLEDSMKKCVYNAIAHFYLSSSEEELPKFSSVEEHFGIHKEVYKLLPKYCYNVRRIYLNEKRKTFYKPSSNEKAINHFLKGKDFLAHNDFKKASKEFKAAIRHDKEFVLGFDNLALAYRRMGKYSKAVKYYNISLQLFPEGNIALLALAELYASIGDYSKSELLYDDLIYYYPNNPNAYLGISKVLVKKAEYSKALENAITSYKIYSDNNSEKTSESEEVIELIYSELNKSGNIEIFEKIARKYNYKIGK